MQFQVPAILLPEKDRTPLAGQLLFDQPEQGSQSVWKGIAGGDLFQYLYLPPEQRIQPAFYNHLPLERTASEGPQVCGWRHAAKANVPVNGKGLPGLSLAV